MKFEGKEYEVGRNENGTIISIHEIKGMDAIRYSTYAMFAISIAAGIAVQFLNADRYLRTPNQKRFYFGIFTAMLVTAIVLSIVTETQRRKPVDAETFARLSADPNFK